MVAAAQQANVKYITYTSYAKADSAKAALAKDHQITETAIKNSGLAYSFLRNTWYLKNEAMTIKTAATGKPFIFASGDGKISWAAERDYADATALVMTTQHPHSIYEFGGKHRTYLELAHLIQKVSGVNFLIQSVNLEDYQALLKQQGVTDTMIMMLVGMQKMIKDGELDNPATDLAEVLDRPLSPVENIIKELLN